ncbi:DUF58 domain-containing protein [Mycetocola tolaasinivorans]|uniref:DUF58 domain-containing protein n=1 Tax=Mycetocola tolaasinivorans TaxID=76635 RepID=A0A3L7A7B5_9MICO|nr:DUF58 domain-containing protein [Mycetocola tolaasinivorans]RLP76034.1 DUF58 domain-containing protein [Mycetocola tolaasinivorans]
MAITGWFVLLLGVGVIPIVVGTGLGGEPGLIALGWIALVVILLALDLALAASPRALRLERAGDRRARLGEPASVLLYLTNSSARTLSGIVRDAWEPSAGAQASRVRVRIPGRERRLIRTILVPSRRGERRSASVTVRSFGPLRLGARQATLNAPGTLRVLPPFRSRRHLPSRLARLRELDGATSLMVRGQGTEFDSLRDYVRGDDVRSIDWRASARRMGGQPAGGEHLVVRTWRPERDRRVIIVVDTGRAGAARIADEPRLDTAFEASLLLAALATRAGDRVDLLAFDRRVRGRVTGSTGAALLENMVNTMADIEPELIETDWSAIPSEVRQITSQRSLVVILTAAESPGSAGDMIASLPELTARHLVVVTSVRDPEALDARTIVDSRADVYEAAAAERSLLDAERVAQALRRVGADPISGAPEALPPLLADHYLALKAAGRL